MRARRYEALATLQVIAYKLGSECQQRLLSFTSRDFGDAAAAGVIRAMETLPAIRSWVAKLSEQLETRMRLPLGDTGLPPRFVRMCDVYELSDAERQLVGALMLMRTSHAFSQVKLGSSVCGRPQTALPHVAAASPRHARTPRPSRPSRPTRTRSASVPPSAPDPTDVLRRRRRPLR